MFKILIPVLMFFSWFEPVDPHIREAARFKKEINKQLKEKYNLSIGGTGGGFVDQINTLGMTYEIKGFFTVDEARILMVSCMEEVYEAINADLAIRPFLKNHPFNRQQLELSISFLDGIFSLASKHQPQPLTYVLVGRDAVVYCIDDGKMLQDVHEESYSEAYKIVYGKDIPCTD